MCRVIVNVVRRSRRARDTAAKQVIREYIGENDTRERRQKDLGPRKAIARYFLYIYKRTMCVYVCVRFPREWPSGLRLALAYYGLPHLYEIHETFRTIFSPPKVVEKSCIFIYPLDSVKLFLKFEYLNTCIHTYIYGMYV